jgi:hypothetical protein
MLYTKEDAARFDLILALACEEKGGYVGIDQVRSVIEHLSKDEYDVLIEKLGFANRDLNTPVIRINDIYVMSIGTTSLFLKKGGFLAHLTNAESETERKINRETLELKNLDLNVKNSTRVFKTYWWTFGMAVVALLISLILLALKLFGK